MANDAAALVKSRPAKMAGMMKKIDVLAAPRFAAVRLWPEDPGVPGVAGALSAAFFLSRTPSSDMGGGFYYYYYYFKKIFFSFS
jgi:hypothetical protein